MSVKNMTRVSYDKDSDSSQKMAGSTKSQKQFKFSSEFYISASKKSDKEDSQQKSSLVAWESANRSKLLLEEDKSIDMSKVTKGSMNYSSSYYSPKGPQSVERPLQQKVEKTPAFSPYKMSMLPNLKVTTSQKRFNF